MKSPFAINNIRKFIAIRIFFNSRFYYPVFMILFLDFGLTAGQFAVLNSIWALSIICLEIPSGAIADIIGKKSLVVYATILMIIEIAVLCVIPLGNITLIFVAFLINRLLSGAAEAAMSGADEALAYDSLKAEGDENEWPKVLEKVFRFQSIGFVLAMAIGAFVYDVNFMQKIFAPFNIELTQQTTMRFPLYLNLITAIVALYFALGLKEIKDDNAPQEIPNIKEAFLVTLKAGKWILMTPFAFMIIFSGVAFDNIIRMLVTLNSQYYRLIGWPEASFGILGAFMAALGLVLPRLSLYLVENKSPIFNLYLLGTLTWVGLFGVTIINKFSGLAFMMLVFSGMNLLQFFLSHYLNRITDSSMRATVLSFKGLSINIGYGITGLLFAALLAGLRNYNTTDSAALDTKSLEDNIFIQALDWFHWYFIIIFIAVMIVGKIKLKNSDAHRVI